MAYKPLDLDAVRAFIHVAELDSFTRAAEAMETTQAAVSLRIQRLERRVGHQLVERTPRYVQLSPHGVAFLERARELVDAHERALSVFGEARQRVAIGISDHVAGPDLPALIARLTTQDPQLLIKIRIGSSGDLLQSYDRRELDAVIARMNLGRDDGVVLAEESFGWFAGAGWQPRAGEPLPVATSAEPCGVRALAGRLLDTAGIPWIETFVGGGVSAVSAAVSAGLGVAALAPRMLPLGVVDVGVKLKLPEIPRLPILLHSRIQSGPARDLLTTLSAAFRSAVRA